jgi:Transposase, Mutator family
MSADPTISGDCATTRAGCATGSARRKLQTAEGELSVEIPQVREAAETFASKLFPRGTKLVRTEPLKALVIGAFVRGLSMRDVESLCEKAGLGKLSKSTASRVCEELRERYEAFKRRDLYETHLRHPPGRVVPRRDLYLRSSQRGPRRVCWSPGDSPKTANACSCR